MSAAKSSCAAAADLFHPDVFVDRHIGPDADAKARMLAVLGVPTLDALIAQTVPASIRRTTPLNLPAPAGEAEALDELRGIAARNQVFRSYIGMGYSDCIVPAVIQRGVLENPGWYTQYTPYQAEIAQGRLECLLNFQTMVCDLTSLPIANASLLDEATAAAEAMSMCLALAEDEQRNVFFVAQDCHPQTIAVVRTRAEPLGLNVVVGCPDELKVDERMFGALVQYPGTHGTVRDYRQLAEKVHGAGAKLVVASDLLALCLLSPPGEWGADIAIGSSQRFGVPLGYGGPHAAFFACREEHKRHMPGRLVGVSRDANGQPALRLSLQTREQHIRREKATSNICTAQALLANMAALYAVYHGPERLRAIAMRVHGLTCALAEGLKKLGFTVKPAVFFDTIHLDVGAKLTSIRNAARERRINLRVVEPASLAVSLDERTCFEDLDVLLTVFAGGKPHGLEMAKLHPHAVDVAYAAPFARTSPFLTHPVFNSHHSETEMMRYLKRLENRDLSLTTSMIPLGSCTMKLNAAAEMAPVGWSEFANLHPFAPLEQCEGYQTMFRQLGEWLAACTGFAATSLQPNAGSQGEYAGLLVIAAYHRSRGQGHRDVCLIPTSAHGTNPASAVMCGLRVVAVACDASGNVDVTDLKAKAAEHAEKLACLMVTYPSTHGVFEEAISDICRVIHGHGGQVYMDGANMNAQVGLTAPGLIGADVCHLNLHKTFCIPHGGGGPGMGPICVASHLAPFLPDHPVIASGNGQPIGAVSAAPWGSSLILTIPWMYIRMMGASGLTEATKVAILNANYIAARLAPHYPVLYRGGHGRVAHECILDLRGFKAGSGIEVEDVAKRLMDYGFHAPTVSFPVVGTMMIEPTESESLTELDRFCDAMIAIRAEIQAITDGKSDRKDNPLKLAPHTMRAVCADQWQRGYSRETAAFPAPWLRDHKYWPTVARIDSAFGDRNLICTCVGMDAYRA